MTTAVFMGVNILGALFFSVKGIHGLTGGMFASILLFSILVGATIGRSLFYAVVIPTTMPGAFFWKNQGFEEHAKETALADMPQLGVERERHHPFQWDALLQTVKETLNR